MRTNRDKNTFIKNCDKNAFIMMRYRDTEQFRSIEDIITKTLDNYGLIASFAKDSVYEDDLWQNITFYMDNSSYGVVIFEEIDEREFNPNVSLELGYMYASKKKCLLLKDKRMPKLPTDVCGKIYKDFDTYNLTSIQNQLTEWCERDLQLSKKERVIYDSRLSDKELSKFWAYGYREHFDFQFQKVNEATEEINLKIESLDNESVGGNLIIRNCIKGVAKFKYKAVKSLTKRTNLYYCLIPMVGNVSEIIEYSSERHLDPDNENSPYRIKHFVLDKYINDDKWHEQTIEFDFSNLEEVSYCIFGVRINEGCSKKGKGILLTKDVKIIGID